MIISAIQSIEVGRRHFLSYQIKIGVVYVKWIRAHKTLIFFFFWGFSIYYHGNSRAIIIHMEIILFIHMKLII